MRADKIPLDVGQAAEYRRHQAPGAGAGVGPRFRQGSELRLRVNDPPDDGEQVEGRAGEGSFRLHKSMPSARVTCIKGVRSSQEPAR
jgi:hypothetical protein